MIHHFADFLDRDGNYWQMVANRERYAYFLDENIADKQAIRIATIQGEDSHWEQIFECPNLEELTLHFPNKTQIASLGRLTTLKRLRITKIQLKDIEILSQLPLLEELVLEYVSGFSDLSPLKQLKQLKSVHFENLRKVSDFSGLSGIESLKYLSITGTLDWNQPIENFDFLQHLPNLEVLRLGWVKCKQEFPMFLPALSLKKLKRVKLSRRNFPLKEFVFWELAFAGVEGVKNELFLELSDGHIDLLGSGSGYIKAGTKPEAQRREAFIQKYHQLQQEVSNFLATIS